VKKESLEHDKCLSCEHIPCANLFSNKDELDGGELYVLYETIAKKQLVPCQPITPLHSCCLLWQTAFKLFDEGKYSPLLNLMWQCFYDLKTSAFLALTAHYRGAIQLLRPVIENILVGIYFEDLLVRATSENEVNQAGADFENWSKGNYKLNGKDLDFKSLKKWLENNKVITDEGNKNIGRLWGELGKKYLHPQFGCMDIGDEKCSTCPSTTRYDRERYFEWLGIFQDIIDLVIDTMLSYFPTIEETSDAKEALGYLKNLEFLERELEIPMIKSEKLKDRIAQLSDNV